MEVEKIISGSYSGNKNISSQDTTGKNTPGFGTDENTEQGIDLNKQLVRNKPATYFMKVNGSSMINAGIVDGDLVIVDRSIIPVNGKIVIVTIDGEMLIRRYEKTMNRLRLIPETSRLSAIEVSEFMDCKIWGVVTCIIRNI
jgi:DNA polymerase V